MRVVGPRAVLVAVAILGACVVAACGGDDPRATGTEGSGSELSGSVTVAAAASLEPAFTALADDFTELHPDVEVTFAFDSSSTLATQILEGAPADVYASADEENMASLTGEGLVAGAPQVFARNELVIVTRPGNPLGIASLADLADAGVITLCGAEVPCGRYAAQALTKAGVVVDESNVTRGDNVGATLTAVTEGDAVAAIVYVTDARAAGAAVDAVEIPAEENVLAAYPIGVLADAGAPAASDAFVAFVLGDDGQAVLRAFGFLPPT